MKTFTWQKDNGGWVTLATEEVEQWFENTSKVDVYKTVQEYPNISNLDIFVAPLYFDFDSPNLVESLEDTKKVVEWLSGYTTPQVYFSGGKGFHVVVDQKVLGIKPQTDLHKKMKSFVSYIDNLLGGLPTLDFVVYSAKRMLRLPNSIHGKSKLYKIPLTVEELNTKTVEDIQELAKAPRAMVFQNALESRELVSLWNARSMDYEVLNAQTFKEQKFCFSKEVYPVCVRDILDNGWKVEGNRNLATIQLATFFKEIEQPLEETIELLCNWVERFTSAQGSGLSGRLASTKTVTTSIYESNRYVFGCNYIRSVGDTNNKVACTGTMCEFLEDNINNTAEELDLFSTVKAEHTGKLVSTEVIVAAKRNSPYIVPNKVEFSCYGREKCSKTQCPLFYKAGNVGVKEVGQERPIIGALGANDQQTTEIIKRLSGIPFDCKAYTTEVLENTNIEECLVTPTLENGDYVLRKVYLLNNLEVEENKHYRFVGKTYAHPKTQEGTILVRDVKPLTDKIDDFVFNEDIQNSINKFKIDDFSIEKIDTKIESIVDFFEHNIMKLAQRKELVLGLLLTYLSVLRINTPWEQNTRGWVNLVILGDTGTGKSTGVEKLQKALNLGQATKAETTGRTGLVYKLEQTAGSWFIMWGLLPRNDRELLWLDECSEIPKETYGEMTETRSSGKVQVNRAVSAETKARVRLILTGNAKFGKQLADYTQPVEALSEMFLKEDIRRFDFGMFLKSADVDSSLYNTIIEDIESPYNIQDFKNLILYAWSRQPNQVTLKPETIEALQRYSLEMSREYGNATSIPLVSPSDQKYKLLRLAVGLALLTGSTEGENVIVEPAHIEFIYKYLKGIYDYSGGLQFFARKSTENERLTPQQCKSLEELIINSSNATFRAGADGPSKTYIEVVTYLNTAKFVTEKALEQHTLLTPDESKGVVNLLVRSQCLRPTQYGLQKTGRLNQFIAWCYEQGTLDNGVNII